MIARNASTVTPIPAAKVNCGENSYMDDSSTFNIDSQVRDAESPDFFRLDNRQGNQDDSSHSLTLLPIEVPTPKQPQN